MIPPDTPTFTQKPVPVSRNIRKIALARSGAATILGQACSFLIAAGGSMILARLLTPSDFGLLAMVNTLVMFVISFRDFGLPMAALQERDLDHTRASALFWFNLRVTILVAILMLLMAPVLVWFFGEPRLLMITTVMTFGVAVAALSNQHEAMLIREARFEALVKWDVAFLFCGVLTAIVAAAAGLGYWALVVQHLVWQIGRATAIWIVCGWIPVRPSRLGDTARSIRGLVSFGAYLTGFRVDDAS